jgi:hypothetical protein
MFLRVILTKEEIAEQNLDEIFSPVEWVYGDDERLDVKRDAAPEKAKADADGVYGAATWVYGEAERLDV